MSTPMASAEATAVGQYHLALTVPVLVGSQKSVAECGATSPTADLSGNRTCT